MSASIRSRLRVVTLLGVFVLNLVGCDSGEVKPNVKYPGGGPIPEMPVDVGVKNSKSTPKSK